MTLGMIHDEPFDIYLRSGAVGSHALGDFAASPLLYARKYLSGATDTEPRSDAFAFGTLFHAALLEGDKAVAQRFVMRPEGLDRRTKDGKAAWAELEASGKQITSAEDMALVDKMRAAVRSKTTAATLLSRGAPEVVFRAPFAGGLTLQCRCDWFDEVRDAYQRPTILDVKTVESIADFDRQFRNYAYYRQAGFYQLVVTEALKLPGAYPRFIFLVCEKGEPNDCALFEPCETTLDYARTECLGLLKRMAECAATNDWPGQPDAVQSISLPDWQLDKGAAA